MTLEQFNASIDALETLEPLLDEYGNPLPIDKMWLVVGSHVTEEHQRLAAENWGIEFRTAMIDGKLCTVSGL